MAGKYASFTDRARKVLQLGSQEARRFDVGFIDTEHLLLALGKEGSGVAARVLKSLGVNWPEFRPTIEALTTRGNYLEWRPMLPFAPMAESVINRAIEEARLLGHDFVSTSHILLGLLHEEDGVAAKALASAGITYAVARAELLRTIGNECLLPSED